MASMEMMRRYLDHITAGEFDAAMEMWADDIVLHVSGTHTLAGDYIGKEAAAGYLSRGLAMVDSLKIEEHDLLISDSHAVVLSISHADRGDSHAAIKRAVVYHTDADKITELWIIDEDQKAAAEFLA